MPENIDAESEHLRAADKAIEILKPLPLFASVQIEVIESVQEISHSYHHILQKQSFPAPDRLAYAVRLLDARASGYVKLVTDILTQEAFMAMLNAFKIKAWEDYAGAASIKPVFGNAAFEAIEQRQLHWIKEGYRRIASTSGTIEQTWSRPSALTSDEGTFLGVQKHPQVFVSYSQDREPESHCRDVHALAERLRSEGIDVSLDAYEPQPKEGWPCWMLSQISNSDFVLCVCTETYRKRFETSTGLRSGKGARFEGYVITTEIYQKACVNSKFVPVLLESADESSIPLVLQSANHYKMPGSYDALYALITGQQLHPKVPLGKIRRLDNNSKESKSIVQGQSGFKRDVNLIAAPKLLLEFEGGPNNLQECFVFQAFGDDLALNVLFHSWNREDHYLVSHPDHAFSAPLG